MTPSAGDVESAIARHRSRNASLKRALEDKAVPLYEERPVDVHFWACSQRDAAVLARKLYQLGFLVKLIAPAAAEMDQDKWSVEAGARIAPHKMISDEFTETLVRLAADEDAEYDGWGTAV